MFPYAILSWFRIQPGTTLARVQYFLYQATEPVLRPVRRIIKPMGGLDWSFLVVILVAQIVADPGPAGLRSEARTVPGTQEGMVRLGPHGQFPGIPHQSSTPSAPWSSASG